METETEKLQLRLITETGLKKVYLAERDGVRRVLAELSTRVHSGYDFNADPDAITALVGAALRGDRLPDLASCSTCHGSGVDLFESVDGEDNACPDCALAKGGQDLLPCPYCGSAAEITDESQPDNPLSWFFARCKNHAECNSWLAASSPAKVAGKWNRRSQQNSLILPQAGRE